MYTHVHVYIIFRLIQEKALSIAESNVKELTEKNTRLEKNQQSIQVSFYNEHKVSVMCSMYSTT